jgi:hypothetical protein
MKRIPLVLMIAACVVTVVLTVSTSGQTEQNAAPVFVTKMPAGYRDWKLISVAHEAGNLNSIGAILGNDAAIKAYREKTLPFPDGAVIAALHYMHNSSEENNKVSRTPKSTPPRADGDLVTSTTTAHSATKCL